MLRSIRNSCAILTLTAILSGCGASADQLLREQIALTDRIAEAYEKVTDKKSYDEAEPKIKLLSDQLVELDEKFNAVSPQRKEVALASCAAEMDQAMTRLKTAKTQAARLAFNVKQ
jgi:hypothetical protein